MKNFYEKTVIIIKNFLTKLIKNEKYNNYYFNFES